MQTVVQANWRHAVAAGALGGIERVNWLARKAVDGYRALTNKVYARRYGTMARQLGLDDVAEELWPPEQFPGPGPH